MLYLVGKRIIDVFGACIGLAITSLLAIPIAIIVLLDSPGPLLFTQKRLGKDERIFRVYKFRTMHIHAASDGTKPKAYDKDVTRAGRFLRRSSMDELPQFWNVLRGEMSLVGPRPEQLSFAEYYQPWQRRRFAVKPGMTGWWQVNGRPQPMYGHTEYDLYYVEHRGWRLDLLILLRTVRAVLSGEGAV
jgi:lipopolysaccharide/colanic/teichoic acid biosynthesis glycosyltransferase